MGRHTTHQMHDNSLEAYHVSVHELSKRAQDIYYTLAHSASPMTAREVLDKLFPGRGDPNLVRPRLTELRKEGWVEEFQSVVDDASGHTVVAYKAVSQERRAAILEERVRARIDGQGELF